MREEKGKYISISSDVVIDGEYMWLSSINYNAVLKIEIKTGILVERYTFPESFKKEMCISMVKVDHEIYFAPYNAEKFWRLSIAKKEFEEIPTDLSAEEKREKHKFSRVLSYGRTVFLFGQKIRRILKYDIDDKSIEKIDVFKNFYGKVFGDEWEAYIDDYYYEDGMVYLPLARKTCVLSIDLQDMSFNMDTPKINEEDISVRTIDRYNESSFVISDNVGRIFKWMRKENKCFEIKTHHLPRLYIMP